MAVVGLNKAVPLSRNSNVFRLLKKREEKKGGKKLALKIVCNYKKKAQNFATVS